jgi:hypothetical protein
MTTIDPRPSLDRLVRKLQLEPMRAEHLPDGTVFQKFNWPRKNNGTKYDRMVLVKIFPDGTWSEYLDSGQMKTDAIVRALQAMVKVS